jgi:Lysozyme like domain
VAVYTYAQLEGLWINAGGSTATAPIAAAIAEAESAGNSGAVNATDNNGTQTSWGLWQISNGTHSQPAPNILDPGVNAQQAVAKYQASGWQPWGTYTSGAYKAFLSGSTTPQTAGLPATAAATSSATASYSVTCLFGFPGVSLPLVGDVGSFCMFSRSEARALIGGLVLGAAGVIGLAAVVILAASAFEHSGAASAVGSAAEKVAPAALLARSVTPAARTERQLAGREATVGKKERVTRLEKREKKAGS